MSQCGKKARNDLVHIRTTGVVSFARKKDEFKLIHKREANEVEFFDIAYQTKVGSYVEDTSRQLMERAREEISKKITDLGGSEHIDLDQQSKIEKAVMIELVGLRRMRNDYPTNVTNQNQVLALMAQVETQKRQIESQNNQIESQNKQIEILNQTVDDFRGEFQVFRTAFKDEYGGRTSKDKFVTTCEVSRKDVSNTQLSFGASHEDYQ